MRSVRQLAVLLAAVWVAGAQARSPVDAAWDLVARGQREEAVRLLRGFVAKEPANADARMLLGSLLMEAGDKQGSVEQLSAAVKLRPRSAESHNALGEAYDMAGDAKSAKPEFERAVALDPRHAQAQANLGGALLQLGDAKSAAPHLDAAIRLLGAKPEAAHARYLRGRIYLDERDYPKAVQQLKLEVKLAPDFAEAWSDLGEARKNLFEDDAALAAFEKSVQLNPDGAVAQTRYGTKLLDAGRNREAAEHLRVALRTDPRNQSTLNALQLALRRDGQAAEADEVKKRLEDVIRSRDRGDQALVAAIEINNRGAELEKSGNVRGALDNYREALNVYPDHVGIRVNLAVALLKTGQWEEGLAQMREALRRDPDNSQIKAALADAESQYKTGRK